GAELQADDACTDDHEVLGNSVELERLRAGDDRTTVEFHAGQGGDLGAGRKYHVLRHDLRDRAVRGGDANLARGGEFAAALVTGCLVLLDEERHAVRVLLNHCLATVLHGLEVELHALDLYAVLRGLAFGLLVNVARFEECLAGDAAYADTGAAEGGLALHQRYVETELRGADGGHVAAGAGADYDDVVLRRRGAGLIVRLAH